MYEDIQPFVVRYIDYLVKYADINCISRQLTELTKITKLTSLTSLTRVNCVSYVNSVNHLDIEWAKAMISPCLDYAQKVVKYVDEESTIGTVLRVLGNKNTMKWSDLLRRSHLTAKQLVIVLETLEQRREYTRSAIEKKKGYMTMVVKKL